MPSTLILLLVFFNSNSQEFNTTAPEMILSAAYTISCWGSDSTWVMEGDEDKVLDGSGPPAQGLLQDPRGTIYHLFQIVVHGAGHIEHKGQRRCAVIGSILLLGSGDGQQPLRADTKRQR